MVKMTFFFTIIVVFCIRVTVDTFSPLLLITQQLYIHSIQNLGILRHVQKFIFIQFSNNKRRVGGKYYIQIPEKNLLYWCLDVWSPPTIHLSNCNTLFTNVTLSTHESVFAATFLHNVLVDNCKICQTFLFLVCFVLAF